MDLCAIGRARNDIDVIERLGAAISAALFHHQVPARAAVDPMFFAIRLDHRGFIGVQRWHWQQPFDGGAFHSILFVKNLTEP